MLQMPTEHMAQTVGDLRSHKGLTLITFYLHITDNELRCY